MKIDSAAKLAQLINEDISCSPVFNDNVDGNTVKEKTTVIVSTPEGKYFMISVRDITNMVKSEKEKVIP